MEKEMGQGFYIIDDGEIFYSPWVTEILENIC